MSVKSPFLRYIVNLCGNLGVQLLPYDTLSGVINLLQNLILSILFRIAIFNGDLNGTSRVPHLKRIKPFFGAFFELTVSKFYPYGTVLGMLHYIVYGPRILALLDEPLLREPFKKRPRRSFALTFLIHAAFFFAGNNGNIIIIMLDLNLFNFLFQFTALYALSLCVSFHLFVIQYLHYSTAINLRRIKLALCRKLSQTEESELIFQFIQLAILNRKLYWLIALPSLVHYTVSTIYSMVLIYSIAFLDFPFRAISYPIISSLYFLYIVTANQANVQLAEDILQQFKRKESETRWLLYWRRRRPQVRNDALRIGTSTTIRRHELEVYLDYFRMSFINLAIFDRPLLLSTAIITLNYLIFIYQP